MRKVVILTWLLFAGAAAGQDMPLSQVLIDGEGWKEVKLPAGKPELLAGRANGDLFVTLSGDVARVVTVFRTGKAVEMANPTSRVLASASAASVAESPAGKLHYTDPKKKALFLAGRKDPVAEGVGEPSGLAFWKDGGTLVVGDAAGKHLYTFRVKEDGTLDAKEKYYTLRVRPKQPSGVKQLILDDKERLYAATNLGVQVFDPTGRMSGVINAPLREPVTAVALAGEKRDQLFVVCGGKLWQRKTKAKAAWPPDAK